jgi:hypothetical protein
MASRRTPKRRGCSAWNAVQNSLSGRRCSSDIGYRTMLMARSARSGRSMKFSMPLIIIARAVEQNLVLIRAEFSDRKASPGREPAEAIRDPRGQAGDIVEGQYMAVIGGNEEIALLAWKRPVRRGVGVDQGLQHLCEGALGRALLAGNGENRIWPLGVKAGEHPANDEDEIGLPKNVQIGSQPVDRAARFGYG